MRGLSESKYEHLYASLEELEYALNELGNEADPDLKAEISRKRQELEVKFKSYQSTLKRIEALIKGYDEFTTDIKLNLVGKQLKELQKKIKPGCPGYQHWQIGVRLLQRT